MITPLEIVDSAVKIGLGALLSGAGAVLLARLNHKRDAEQDVSRRRRELLEGAAVHVEQFSHSVLKYWGLTTEWVRVNAKGNSLSDDRQTMWDESRLELFHSFKELTRAEATLLLLGEKSAQRLLRAFGEEVVNRRRHAYVGNAGLTLEQITADRTALLDAREAFFDELSKQYSGATRSSVKVLVKDDIATLAGGDAA
jgi:hypothetical protein